MGGNNSRQMVTVGQVQEMPSNSHMNTAEPTESSHKSSHRVLRQPNPMPQPPKKTEIARKLETEV